MIDKIAKFYDYLGDFWALFPDKDRTRVLLYWESLFKITADLYLKLFYANISSGLGFAPSKFDYLWRYYQFIYEIDFKEDPGFLTKGRASSDMITIGTPVQSNTIEGAELVE